MLSRETTVLNANKTNMMCLSRSKSQIQDGIQIFTLKKEVTVYVQTYKYLGFLLEDNLFLIIILIV